MNIYDLLTSFIKVALVLAMIGIIFRIFYELANDNFKQEIKAKIRGFIKKFSKWLKSSL